ncbi:thermonuclease family protein [Streptomyces sp. NPDC002935]|uniref:thermonuclease family protein n=1 Tax=unclassified Streptomyces TaxID=2593676 RepID=UPI0033254A81
MPMLLIKGSFTLKDTAPDGDTVHFIADNTEEWQLVGGKNPVQLTPADHAKLRLEGIDALETHYHGAHQPLPQAHAAANELVEWLGFTDVQRDPDESVTASTPATTPGFVLTRGADVYGRVIALVGKGTPPGTSGTEITVDAALLKKTANHHMVSEGLAFPTFYRSLFKDLRLELTAAAQQAEAAGKGVWPDDVSLSGVKVTGLSSIENDSVILPKLFRRLVDYLKLGMPITWFPAYLAGQEDPVTVLSTGKRFMGLHHVIEVSNGDLVRLSYPAADLLFDEA